MECSLKECQWYAFGQCCPESAEIMNETIPNSKECPHYYDLEKIAEEERKGMTDSIFDIFEELGRKLSDKYVEEILSLRGLNLWKTYSEVFDLYEKHKFNQFLDKMLNEIDEHGIEWVREKYGLNQDQEELSNESNRK